MSPRDAQIVDPQHRIFLECAWEALESAGYAAGTTDHAVGVYAGASMNTYLFQILRDPALVESVGPYQLMLGNDKDFLCTRVSYKLNLKGPKHHRTDRVLHFSRGRGDSLPGAGSR